MPLTILACQQTKQLKEMHDSTADMQKSTQQMGSDMSHLKSMTGSLKEYTLGLCRGSRQSFGESARDELLKKILDVAVDPADKISEAGRYMMAFEFQARLVCGEALPMELDNLYGDATNEFFKSLQRFNTGKPVKPLIEKGSIAKEGENEKNLEVSFNAMAAALSLLNPFQEVFTSTKSMFQNGDNARSNR